jgi:hypothetical protein
VTSKDESLKLTLLATSASFLLELEAGRFIEDCDFSDYGHQVARLTNGERYAVIQFAKWFCRTQERLRKELAEMDEGADGAKQKRLRLFRGFDEKVNS